MPHQMFVSLLGLAEHAVIPFVAREFFLHHRWAILGVFLKASGRTK